MEEGTGNRPVVAGAARLALLWRLSVAPDVVFRSFVVGLVVGTILNLINQGDSVWGEAESNWSKLFLTYMIPYFVATYGSVSARLRDRKRAGGA